jgi:flagellar protein FliS
MVNSKKLASYRSLSVETASPGKLILMLFDGALRFLHAANEGFKLPSQRERNEAVHNNLIKAQDIVHELQRSLNIRDGGDFSVNMFKLYDFMNSKLMEANLGKNPENIRVVMDLLGQIREAWDEMLRDQAGNAEQQISGLSMSA